MSHSSSPPSKSSMEKVNFRTKVLSRHLNHNNPKNDDNFNNASFLQSSPCLSYTPPELSEPNSVFDVSLMRKLMDGHNIEDRDWLYNLMLQSKLFNPREKGGKIFILPDYNQSMEQQKEMTMKRVEYLLDHGVFQGWLTRKGPEAELRKFAFLDVVGVFDHSLAIKIGVHFFLWYVGYMNF